MQELEKILEEIKENAKIGEMQSEMIRLEIIEDIIYKHINDGWILIAKERPEEGQEVWVSTKTDCVRRGTFTEHFAAEQEGIICSDGFIGISAANAWQPYVLPDPYRPEGTVE